MSLPNITAEGRLGRDPELRFVPSSGKAVVSFSIACSERRKNRDTQQWEDGSTTWLDVTAWESKAEAIAEELKRGDLVIVTGRLKQREYEKDGVKRTAFDVQADTVARVVTAAKGSGRAAQAPAAQSGGVDPWSTSSSPTAANDDPPW